MKLSLYVRCAVSGFRWVRERKYGVRVYALFVPSSHALTEYHRRLPAYIVRLKLRHVRALGDRFIRGYLLSHDVVCGRAQLGDVVTEHVSPTFGRNLRLLLHQR